MNENQIAELQKPLEEKRIKRRQGAGRRTLDYLETHDVIRRANEIFGFGQWGHEVVELACLGEEPTDNGKEGSQRRQGFRVGYRCTVRLVVDGCVPVSGIGYGDATEYTASRITPHELAAKEAESDALKRALKNYGDQFGLILYAKDRQALSQRESVDSEPAQDPGSSRSESFAPPPGVTADLDAKAVTLTATMLELAAERGVDIPNLRRQIAENKQAGSLSEHIGWLERGLTTLKQREPIAA